MSNHLQLLEWKSSHELCMFMKNTYVGVKKVWVLKETIANIQGPKRVWVLKNTI